MSNVRRATTGGRRAAFVIVLHSMWRRAEGKFALIVLALWLLIAIVSLFWTPLLARSFTLTPAMRPARLRPTSCLTLMPPTVLKLTNT